MVGCYSPTKPTFFRGAQRRSNPCFLSAATVECFAALAMTVDGDLLPLHQNHPDIVDVGERRSRQQKIAVGGEEGGGVVIVQIRFCVEAERSHLRTGGLVDDRAGGIVGAPGAALAPLAAAATRR